MKKLLIGLVLLVGCLPQRYVRSHDEVARCEVWKADPAEVDTSSFNGHDQEMHVLGCETQGVGRLKCPILLRKVEEEQHKHD